MSEQAIGLSRMESRGSVAGFHWALLLTILAPYVVLLALRGPVLHRLVALG